MLCFCQIWLLFCVLPSWIPFLLYGGEVTTALMQSSGSLRSSSNASAHLMMSVSIFSGVIGRRLFCGGWGFGCEFVQDFVFFFLESSVPFGVRPCARAVSVGVEQRELFVQVADGVDAFFGDTPQDSVFVAFQES